LGRPDLGVEIVSAVEAARSGSEPMLGWSPLLEGLYLVAGERTPLPATGAPPDWTTGCPADAVQAAGRGYRDRARAQLAAADTTVGDTTGDSTATSSCGGSVGAAGGAR
jgi:hypothetical protein